MTPFGHRLVWWLLEIARVVSIVGTLFLIAWRGIDGWTIALVLVVGVLTLHLARASPPTRGA